MEQRQFGGSGFKVPLLSLDTFGGGNDFFKASGVEQATRLIGVCLKAGLKSVCAAEQ